MASSDNGDETERKAELAPGRDDVLDVILHELATLKVGQDAIKTAIRQLSPRLDTLAAEKSSLNARIDGLSTRLDTLVTELRELAERVHRANNLLTPFSNELYELHQSRILFERSLELLEARVKLSLHARATDKEEP